MKIKDLYDIFMKHPSVCLDSRNVTAGSIFFSLKGDRYDGNRFANEALGKGCSYAVIDDPGYHKNDRYILVKDVLTSLQKLSAYHRRHFRIPVLAVTGSNGKTTTKELCHDVLSSKLNTITTQANLNNHIGVPMTILRMRQGTEIAVIEMGANHQGEIASLCHIASPSHGLITNIGRAHLEGFNGFEGVITAKKELYDFIRSSHGLVFINAGNELLNSISSGLPRVAYGEGKETTVSGEVISSDPFLSVGIDFKSTDGKVLQHIHVNTGLIGQYNFENILAAACVGLHFGVDPETIAMAIASYKPSNYRSQYIKTGSNTVILDAYNANPSSMEQAILNFMRIHAGHKAMILGDMFELGRESEQEHRKILEIVRASGVQTVVLVGEIFSSLSNSSFCFTNTSQAMDYLREHPITSSMILIKGSRLMGLEKLMDVL
jgi:UDP-N-acetylmuramoyl-tripeptide--D-alanyl-D-alanine ligase